MDALARETTLDHDLAEADGLSLRWWFLAASLCGAAGWLLFTLVQTRRRQQGRHEGPTGSGALGIGCSLLLAFAVINTVAAAVLLVLLIAVAWRRRQSRRHADDAKSAPPSGKIALGVGDLINSLSEGTNSAISHVATLFAGVSIGTLGSQIRTRQLALSTLRLPTSPPPLGSAGSSGRSLTGSAESAQVDTAGLVVLCSRELGAGSYAKVWEGRYNGERVAVKCLFPPRGNEVVQPEVLLTQQKREIEALMRCLNPRVLRFFGCADPATVQWRGAPEWCQRSPWVLVTEMCERGSLRDVLNEMSRGHGSAADELGAFRRVRMALDAAQGMRYLHETLQLVHRDLKSPNLMVAKDFRVKVGDLGMARFTLPPVPTAGTDSAAEALSLLPVNWCCRWMAPEQMQSQGVHLRGSKEADVYAFGAVLLEIATLQLPWAGVHTSIIPFKVTEQNQQLPLPDRSELSSHIPDAPPAVLDGYDRLVRHCTAAQPEQRPAFPEICARLHDLLVQLPVPRPRGAAGGHVAARAIIGARQQQQQQQQQAVGAAAGALTRSRDTSLRGPEGPSPFGG